jgi:hypothetical protein
VGSAPGNVQYRLFADRSTAHWPRCHRAAGYDDRFACGPSTPAVLHSARKTRSHLAVRRGPKLAEISTPLSAAFRLLRPFKRLIPSFVSIPSPRRVQYRQVSHHPCGRSCPRHSMVRKSPNCEMSCYRPISHLAPPIVDDDMGLQIRTHCKRFGVHCHRCRAIPCRRTTIKSMVP